MKRMLDQKLINFLISLGDSLKYESSSNAFEIGTNLEVDGVARLPHIVIDPTKEGGGVDITFDKDTSQLKFNFLGDGISYVLEPDLSDGSIVTTDMLKTLFGNQSMYGEGNIDLYRHQLKVTDARSIIGTFIIISSNNLVIDSLQDLTNVTKPKNGYIIDGIIDTGGTLTNARLTFNGTTWDLTGFTGAFDSIEDIVTTI